MPECMNIYWVLLPQFLNISLTLKHFYIKIILAFMHSRILALK